MGTPAIVADRADISWDAKKKNWAVAIHRGEEVIKRSPDQRLPHDASDDQLRDTAVQMAKEDGYELQAGNVRILR